MQGGQKKVVLEGFLIVIILTKSILKKIICRIWKIPMSLISNFPDSSGSFDFQKFHLISLIGTIEIIGIFQNLDMYVPPN